MKSSKPIPVMIVGALFFGHRYTLRKWFCILLISVGIAMFLFKPVTIHRALQVHSLSRG